jgi:hypothetical protein
MNVILPTHRAVDHLQHERFRRFNVPYTVYLFFFRTLLNMYRLGGNGSGTLIIDFFIFIEYFL